MERYLKLSLPARLQKAQSSTIQGIARDLQLDPEKCRGQLMTLMQTEKIPYQSLRTTQSKLNFEKAIGKAFAEGELLYDQVQNCTRLGLTNDLPMGEEVAARNGHLLVMLFYRIQVDEQKSFIQFSKNAVHVANQQLPEANPPGFLSFLQSASPEELTEARNLLLGHELTQQYEERIRLMETKLTDMGSQMQTTNTNVAAQLQGMATKVHQQENDLSEMRKQQNQQEKDLSEIRKQQNQQEKDLPEIRKQQNQQISRIQEQLKIQEQKIDALGTQQAVIVEKEFYRMRKLPKNLTLFLRLWGPDPISGPISSGSSSPSVITITSKIISRILPNPLTKPIQVSIPPFSSFLADGLFDSHVEAKSIGASLVDEFFTDSDNKYVFVKNVILLMGISGAGKTTLFEALAETCRSREGIVEDLNRAQVVDPAPRLQASGNSKRVRQIATPANLRSSHGAQMIYFSRPKNTSALVLIDLPGDESSDTRHSINKTCQKNGRDSAWIATELSNLRLALYNWAKNKDSVAVGSLVKLVVEALKVDAPQVMTRLNLIYCGRTELESMPAWAMFHEFLGKLAPGTKT